MKILCISDQIDPLVYSNTIRQRFADIDLVISAGDLPLEYLEFIVSSLNKPVFFVFGNHNLEDYGKYHRIETSTHLQESPADYIQAQYGNGCTYLGFKNCKEGNLLLSGVSGSLKYNSGLNQFTDHQMFFRLLSLVPGLLINKIKHGRYLDIFVTHASPFGIHDKSDPCHIGFKCFLWFMKTFKPQFLIHGHIHLYDLQDIRVSKFMETTVLNAYSHYILDTGERN